MKPINTGVYTPGSDKTNSKGEVVARVSLPLKNLLLNKNLYPDGRLFDSSNIFSSISHKKYDLPYAGVCHTTINIANRNRGIFTTEQSEKKMVNLRLCYLTGGTGGTYPECLKGGFRWTNPYAENMFSADARNIRVSYTGNASGTVNINNNEIDRTQDYNNIFNVCFINEIDKTKVYLKIYASFIRVFSDNSFNFWTGVDVDKYNPDSPNYTGDNSLWENGYFDDYDPDKGMNYRQYLTGFTLALCYASNSGAFSVSDSTRSGIITLLSEVNVDGEIYYTLPNEMNMGYLNSSSAATAYTIQYPTFSLYNTPPYLRMPSPWISVQNMPLFVKSGDTEDYNRPFYISSHGSGQFEYSSLFNNAANVVSNYVVLTDKASAGATVHLFDTVLPLRDVFRIAAYTLLPFGTCNPGLINNDGSFASSTNVYMGIRNENLTVDGDYIKIRNLLDVENEYIPDDFEPLDPFNPDPVEQNEDDFGDITLNENVTIGAANSFITSYLLTSGNIRVLGSQLWSNLLTYNKDIDNNMLDNFFKVFSGDFENSFSLADIINYFISLKYYPIKNMSSVVSNQLARENAIQVGTGALAIQTGTNLNTPRIITNPIVIIDGGSCVVGKNNLQYSFLDHEPNVACSIYVPYCGTAELTPSAVMGSTITIKYAIDLITGDITAYIMKQGAAYFPVAVLHGTIGFDLLLTGSNANSATAKAITAAKQVTASGITQIASNTITGALSHGKAGAIMGAITGAVGLAGNAVQLGVQLPSMTATQPLQAGTSTALAALISPQMPFVQVRRHNPVTPDNYKTAYGFEAMQTVTIGDVTGFAHFVNPKLDGIPATTEELNMIQQSLQNGVYVK